MEKTKCMGSWKSNSFPWIIENTKEIYHNIIYRFGTIIENRIFPNGLTYYKYIIFI